jgi:hypothetical protein
VKSYGSSLLLAILLAPVLAGCPEEDTDGIVDVRWTIGGATCDRVGVDRVRVSLVKGREAVAGAEAQCDDGEVAVTGVPSGTYTAQVFGYRLGDDVPAYIGTETGVVVPKAGRVTTGVIFLEEAPGAIDLIWRFESGNICSFEGAEWVQISAFDERNRVVADVGMPCDPGTAVNDGLGGPGFEFLEGARGVVLDFLFSGPHEVVVLAYRHADDSRSEWAGSGTTDVANSALSPLEVVLIPCADDPDSLCR